VIQTAPSIPRSYLDAMDETVAEIFSAMLQIECLPVPGPADADPEIAARVRFSGTIEGECIVSFTGTGAASLAQAFLGCAADDAMIDDAVGELGNMLAGAWKRRLGPLASVAGLSVPQVMRGAECVHGPLQTDMPRSYEFAGASFTVQLAVATALEE
jgi:chemotaxis protein CheX